MEKSDKMDFLSFFVGIFSQFVFFYPFIMSLFWMAGALLFFIYRERHESIDFDHINWPMVSFLVPCYNEESTISETIRHLSEMPYPKKGNYCCQRWQYGPDRACFGKSGWSIQRTACN